MFTSKLMFNMFPFLQGHIPESLNIPLYDLIEGWSPFKIGKRLSFLMFGKIDGTEMQEDFLNVCADMCDPEKGITLVCGVGFTSPENPGDFAGFATRWECSQNRARIHPPVENAWRILASAIMQLLRHLTPERSAASGPG
ncbi:unnamed protein product [Ostreobium quekettii]|uniref:Uncharacterized protein n=1 Tax=Ostreobium quekettii TaxID=121088 RepID=A0A8S1JF48_9CHLO|nr:unnamed protein product [Ostreobium quekettii]